MWTRILQLSTLGICLVLNVGCKEFFSLNIEEETHTGVCLDTHPDNIRLSNFGNMSYGYEKVDDNWRLKESHNSDFGNSTNIFEYLHGRLRKKYNEDSRFFDRYSYDTDGNLTLVEHFDRLNSDSLAFAYNTFEWNQQGQIIQESRQSIYDIQFVDKILELGLEPTNWDFPDTTGYVYDFKYEWIDCNISDVKMYSCLGTLAYHYEYRYDDKLNPNALVMLDPSKPFNMNRNNIVYSKVTRHDETCPIIEFFTDETYFDYEYNAYDLPTVRMDTVFVFQNGVFEENRRESYEYIGL